jgi:hypothetical protein
VRTKQMEQNKQKKKRVEEETEKKYNKSVKGKR